MMAKAAGGHQWDREKLAELQELLQADRRSRPLREYHRIGELLNEMRPDKRGVIKGRRWVMALLDEVEGNPYRDHTIPNRLIKFATEYRLFDPSLFEGLDWGVVDLLLRVKGRTDRAPLLARAKREEWGFRDAREAVRAANKTPPQRGRDAEDRMRMPKVPAAFVRELTQVLERVRLLCKGWVDEEVGQTIKAGLENDALAAVLKADEVVKNLLPRAEKARRLLVRAEDFLFPAAKKAR